MEPTKCASWSWIPWSQMWAWSKAQALAEDAGKPVDRKMFLPLVNLYREYPELENHLVGESKLGEQGISGWASRHW